ncbi:MAG: hypothetical protein MHPSP_002757 [Paramarteilia canceri]
MSEFSIKMKELRDYLIRDFLKRCKMVQTEMIIEEMLNDHLILPNVCKNTSLENEKKDDNEMIESMMESEKILELFKTESE